MHIGTVRLFFHLKDNHSLKGKRQVSRSIITRLRHKFNASVAEVDAADQLQVLVVGIATVSNSVSHCREITDKILGYIDGQGIDGELIDVQTEILNA